MWVSVAAFAQRSRIETMAASSERLKDFRIKNLLGKGAFGDVYKVQRVSDGATYALKKINIASMDTKEVGDTLNEIR